MIRRETRRDPALSQVYSAIYSGWNAEQKLRFTQFYQHRDELTLDGGCIIWGLRVVLPPKLRSWVLEELHVGQVTRKNFIWWPGIDQQIEQFAMHCSGCQHVQKVPKPCTATSVGMACVTVAKDPCGLCGYTFTTTFLVVVDVCSNWPEVFSMTSTTAAQTVMVLREHFARTAKDGHYISGCCWCVFKLARSVQHDLYNCCSNCHGSERTFRKDWCTRTAGEW